MMGMMGKSAFFSEGTAGQMKSAPSFAKDDDCPLPKERNGSKIGLGPKPIWGMSDKISRYLGGMSVKENTEEQQLSSGRVTNLLTERVP
jgi:hypothetical protein